MIIIIRKSWSFYTDYSIIPEALFCFSVTACMSWDWYLRESVFYIFVTAFTCLDVLVASCGNSSPAAAGSFESPAQATKNFLCLYGMQIVWIASRRRRQLEKGVCVCTGPDYAPPSLLSLPAVCWWPSKRKQIRLESLSPHTDGIKYHLPYPQTSSIHYSSHYSPASWRCKVTRD